VRRGAVEDTATNHGVLGLIVQGFRSVAKAPQEILVLAVTRSPCRTRRRSTSRRPASPSSRWCSTTSPSPRVRCARVARRPQILKRFVDGAEGEPFYQKRALARRPPWVDIATLTFPSGRHADEVVVNNTAQLVYVEAPG